LSQAKGIFLSFPKIAIGTLSAGSPVCFKGRDGRRRVKVVGQNSGVVIEPKKVIGAIDPLLFTLCKFGEPGWKEPLRVRSFRKNYAFRKEHHGTEYSEQAYECLNFRWCSSHLPHLLSLCH
jgi:hypothetical protein